MAKTNDKLPDGVTMAQLKTNWDLATAAYSRPFRRVRLLDATDRSKLWEAIQSKFPAYQILPDTNHVSYIKNNLLASLYTVGKSAQLIPTTPEDQETVEHLNVWLDHFWTRAKVGYYQMQAGERAALTNIGITQVGWDNQISGGSGDFSYKGGPTYKNIDPTKFMRDPYATSLDTSAYCMTWDDLHKNVLKSNPLYKDTLQKAIDRQHYSSTAAPVELHLDRPTSSEARNAKEYFRLVVHWVRDGDKYHEIHTLDNSEVLFVKEDIKPSAFPFAVVYCNLPAGDVIGTSECARIFANSVAYNIMNSVLLTAEYKNQRPPKFINNMSGLNVASFVKHGNEADYTFVVQGDASKAVHYHQFPMPSAIAPQVMGMLGNDIQQVTGVDGRYTGKDTGSILTTGGIEQALDQATLIDTPKISNYEEYASKLTKLTLANMVEFSPKRKYYVKDKTNKPVVIEIDFPKLKAVDVFDYQIAISSELPKNKARIAQMANILMEKQMQYKQSGMQVDMITPEEWLMLQDLPTKELMQDRMGIQRSADYLEKVSRIIFTYGGLIQNGVDANEALEITAQDFQAAEQPGAPMPEDMMMAQDPMMQQDPMMGQQPQGGMF